MRKVTRVRRTNCATCPWREGSPYAYLKDKLQESAITEGSRICHSTGSNNAINHRTGKPPMICRGARDEQLQFLHRIGFLREPTDRCWNERVKELK
jgi:hypothetical protein